MTQWQLAALQAGTEIYNRRQRKTWQVKGLLREAGRLYGVMIKGAWSGGRTMTLNAEYLLEPHWRVGRPTPVVLTEIKL